MGVTNFIWDEASDNVLYETNENDAVIASYTHRPEPFGELLSQRRTNRDFYYHLDGASSTRKITNDSEAVVKTYIFSGFGEEILASGVTANPFGYKGAVGYYTDEETGDIYVRARNYQPVIGRWLSRDPLLFVDGPNLYRTYFVPNHSDPNGQMLIVLAEMHCSGCGDASVIWEILPRRETFVVQKICWTLKQSKCELAENGCCLPGDEQSCEKCIFELLIEPGQPKERDQWKLPFDESVPRCGFVGHGLITADIREIAHVPNNWSPGGKIDFCRWTIDVGKWLPADQDPDWWLNAIPLDRKVSLMSSVYDCCDSRNRKNGLVAMSFLPFIFKSNKECQDQPDPRR